MLGVLFDTACPRKVTLEQRSKEGIGWWQSSPDRRNSNAKALGSELGWQV